MKWSDIVYIVIIAALAIFSVKNCSPSKNCPELPVFIPVNKDSLMAVIDSLYNLPADTVVTIKVVSRTVIKETTKIDSFFTDPPTNVYVSVNDTAYGAFVVDTITVQGTLLDHRQSITFLEETNTIYVPVPEPVFVTDTLKVPIITEKTIPTKFALSAGAQGGYLFDKAYIAPALEFQINRLNLSLAKPLDNASSFTVQASYRLFAK